MKFIRTKKSMATSIFFWTLSFSFVISNYLFCGYNNNLFKALGIRARSAMIVPHPC